MRPKRSLSLSIFLSVCVSVCVWVCVVSFTCCIPVCCVSSPPTSTSTAPQRSSASITHSFYSYATRQRAHRHSTANTRPQSAAHCLSCLPDFSRHWLCLCQAMWPRPPRVSATECCTSGWASVRRSSRPSPHTPTTSTGMSDQNWYTHRYHTYPIHISLTRRERRPLTKLSLCVCVCLQCQAFSVILLVLLGPGQRSLSSSSQPATAASASAGGDGSVRPSGEQQAWYCHQLLLASRDKLLKALTKLLMDQKDKARHITPFSALSPLPPQYTRVCLSVSESAGSRVCPGVSGDPPAGVVCLIGGPAAMQPGR